MKEWLLAFKSTPIIGFLVLAVMGGIVAHIRRYEQMGVVLTPWQHWWAIVRKALPAVLSSLLVYAAWDALSWTLSWGFVVAGIVAVFASEAFDFAWFLLKEFALKRIGSAEKK